MKKVLTLILIVVSLLVLSGCSNVPRKTNEGWALYYAEQEFENEDSHFNLYAYSVKEISIYENYQRINGGCEVLACKELLFEVELIDTDGTQYVFMVNLVVVDKLIEPNYYKKTSIISYGVEKITHD